MSLPHLRRSRATITTAVTVVILAVVLVATGLAQSGAGQRAARGAGLYSPSEPIVSLSFVHPDALATLGGLVAPTPPRHVAVAFSIANLGHQGGSFSWSVSVGAMVRDRGRVTIAAGGEAGVRRAVVTGCELPRRPRRVVHRRTRAGRGAPPADSKPVPRGPARVRIVVALAQPSRAIDFWVRCHA